MRIAPGGLLIDRGNDTAGAGFDHTHRRLAHADLPPLIFGVRLDIANHQVGPETIHRRRRGQAFVETGERRLRDQQQRKSIGEGELFPRRRVIGIDAAPRALGTVHETQGLTQHLAQPGVHGILGYGTHQRVFPDAGQHTGTARIGSRQLYVPLAEAQAQAVCRDLGIQQRQARQAPLALKTAAVVHQHPAPVTGQTETVHDGRVQGVTARRLQGVTIDGRQRSAHGL